MTFTMPPSTYTFNLEDPDTLESICIVAISSLPEDQSVHILGDPFLRTFTTTFDYGTQQMGLALNINAPEGAKIEEAV